MKLSSAFFDMLCGPADLTGINSNPLADRPQLQAIDKKIEKTRDHINYLSKSLAHRNTHGGKRFRARNISIKDQIAEGEKKVARLEKEREDVLRMERVAKYAMGFEPSVPEVDRLLHAAIVEGDPALVLTFIEKGAAVAGLVDGISPLYRACESGKFNIARILLKKGADPTQKNDHIDYLSKKAEPDWVDQRRTNNNPINFAIRQKDKALIRLLVSHGAPLEELDSLGRSPLYRAVIKGDEDFALFLIEIGANINFQGNDGISLVRMALESNRTRVVKELFARGADLKGVVIHATIIDTR